MKGPEVFGMLGLSRGAKNKYVHILKNIHLRFSFSLQ